MLRISYEVEFRFPDGLSEKAKDLMSKMLTRRPADRISALNALNHGWVRLSLFVGDPGPGAEAIPNLGSQSPIFCRLIWQHSLLLNFFLEYSVLLYLQTLSRMPWN